MIASNNIELMHERISVNALCFPGASMSQLGGHWRELQPARVSFISPPLLAGELDEARNAVEAGGYQVETIAHAWLVAHGGTLERGDDSWAEPRADLSRMIEAAQALGARTVYLVSGGHGSLTWEDAAETFSRAIAPCVEQAKAAGVELAVENALALQADRHITHSLRDAVTLAERSGIGVCIDIFGCWAEAGLRESIERAVALGGLVQVSDYILGDRFLPSRAVPGDGAIPLERILEWILAAGYSGGFDFELIGPRIDQEGHLDATRRAATNVSELLESLGA
jgi:sugar phosphate isomerase/epimerase